MAIVNSTFAALNSGDRFNLINQGAFWEIQDNHAHRVVKMFGDEGEARTAYAKLTARQTEASDNAGLRP